MLPKEHIADTLLHKEFVMKAGRKLIDHLYEIGRDDDALELARRCAVHDNSKLEDEEMQSFLNLPKEGETMKNANAIMPEAVQNFIKLHWKHNRHHPEYFADYREMNELDIMEMVIDWYARSMQFKTNFKEFVKTRQGNRFCFDEEFFTIVWKYCEIIDN